MPEPYTYSALVVDVHDGDTVTMNIDLGMYVQMRGQKVRLLGVKAPELKESMGTEARDYLRRMLHGSTVLVSTKKNREDKDGKEKYGRWLGVIYIAVDGQLVNVNELVNTWLEERCKT